MFLLGIHGRSFCDVEALDSGASTQTQYFIAFKSAIIPGPVGFQPSLCRVSALVAGISSPANIAIQPKCACDSSGEMLLTGTFSPTPTTSATSRIVTPSSATA